MPFFCRVDKGTADLDSFRAVAGGLTPFLAEVSLPSVSSDVLRETTPKKPTAGGLDGCGWREFKALPVAWFDRLASNLTLEEEERVWPEVFWTRMLL